MKIRNLGREGARVPEEEAGAGGRKEEETTRGRGTTLFQY